MEVREGDLLISIVDECEYCKWCWNCDIQNDLRDLFVKHREQLAITMKICDKYEEDKDYGKY